MSDVHTGCWRYLTHSLFLRTTISDVHTGCWQYLTHSLFFAYDHAWRSHRLLAIFDALIIFSVRPCLTIRLHRLLTIFKTLIFLRTFMSYDVHTGCWRYLTHSLFLAYDHVWLYVYTGCWRYLTHSLFCVRSCHMTFTQAVDNNWHPHYFFLLWFK